MALLVAYDGTPFRGWTDVRDRALRPTLSRLLRDDVVLEAASRTDAGVHSRGNACSCALPRACSEEELSQLVYSANQLLPPEVSIRRAALVASDFDVRKTCGKVSRLPHCCLVKLTVLGKVVLLQEGTTRLGGTQRVVFMMRHVLPTWLTLGCAGTPAHAPCIPAPCGPQEYHYFLSTAPQRDPLDRLRQWHVPPRRGVAWDADAAARAAALLRGSHSFAAFGNTPRGRERLLEADPSCHVRMLQLRRLGPSEYQVRVRGDRFLYKMVRNLVGTLVRVGLGELDEAELAGALADGRFARSSSVAITAPAHGLLLHRVLYAPADDPFATTGLGTHGLRPWRASSLRGVGE